MVSPHIQEPLSSSGGRVAISPSPSAESDTSASKSPSIHGKKRRRPGRPSKKDLLERQQTKDALVLRKQNTALLHTKRQKTVHEDYRKTTHHRVGDQVEAIKWSTDPSKEEWYCGRIIQVNDDERVLVHYEGWPPEDADWLCLTEVRPLNSGIMTVRYGPKGRESEASWQEFIDFHYSQEGLRAHHHTGLVQDRRMGLHACPCQSRETIHPERPDRITSILQALHSHRLLRLFHRVRAREATTEELLHVHTYAHVRNYYPIHNTASKPIKITSIAALLNDPETPTSPPPLPLSPSSSPSGLSRRSASVGQICGMGGEAVERADQDDIQRQHRRFSTSQDSPVTPPALAYKMRCGELGIAFDTTFHPLFSSLSARIAAGALIRLADQVAQGYLHNGFALIRPPGHHAEDDGAMGFCFYNNVAVAVAATLEKYPSKIKRVLIIDWDIHHGNGTQKMFYDNPNVLYISLHRWDKGRFYPFSGAPDECGEGDGLGRNINIAFSNSEEKSKPMGDTEFVAAFYHLLIPIARQFGPDMIFVSAGFDAAEGHPENLGGYRVTPRGFAILTKMVNDLAKDICNGRLVLSLEGGYELQPLANSAAASVAQLLPENLVQDTVLELKHSLNAIKPNEGAVQSLRDVAEIQQRFWVLPDQMTRPSYRFHLPSDWRATDSFSTRPKREKRPMNTTVVEGY